MYFVDEKRHTHLLQCGACLVDGILKVEELLYIHHDDAPFVAQCLYKSVAVVGFHKHAVVDVHVHHGGVELVAQLHTIHHHQHLVVGKASLVAIVAVLSTR